MDWGEGNEMVQVVGNQSEVWDGAKRVEDREVEPIEGQVFGRLCAGLCTQDV
jgi:hypothetical protein